MAKEVIDTHKTVDGNVFDGQDLMDNLREAAYTVVHDPKYRDEPIYLRLVHGDQVFGIDQIQVEKDTLTDGSCVFNFVVRLQQELASSDV